MYKSLAIIGESKENTKIMGIGGSDILTIISNNVTVDLLTIANNQSRFGINIYNSKNISINNCKVYSMGSIGIIIDDSRFIIISECDIIENNIRGMWVLASTNITLNNNFIFGNSGDGIMINLSSDIIIRGNNIKGFGVGLGLCISQNCIVTENTIYDNTVQGIRSGYCGGIVKLFHNNFVNNSKHVGGIYNYSHWVWDNGYPSSGNYWSDYNASDFYQGLYQDMTGNDGVGDANYLLRDGKDNYPLVQPWTGKGDMDADCDVDIFDLDRFAQAWGGRYRVPLLSDTS